MHDFVIHHYADSVVYSTEGFIEKNRNFFPPETIMMLRR